MAALEQPVPAVLACGEVRTSLLQSLAALDSRAAAQLLRLRDDESVHVSERPNLYVRSREVLTGVDCRLPTSDGAKVRAVGTVAARAGLVEGRVLQTSAYFCAPDEGPEARRPWGLYLVRPGVLEPFGRLPGESVATGVLRGPGRGELDLGMIAEQLRDQLVCHALLDRRVPFKARLSKLRWAALRAEDGEAASLECFTLARDGLRTVELRLPEGASAVAAAGLCEDLALHDWLLTTVIRMLERGDPPAVHAVAVHLLHLWLPRARVDRSLVHLWDALEEHPGFTRQWHNLAQRVRDRLAIEAVTLPHGRHDI
ncbi:SCO2521 family protein [Streptomyces massasporeus]|uniref:SCO2521 family protein n=1 Tax=Streptomyces massasporeus TaxID=67324 RepID=UPI00380C7245